MPFPDPQQIPQLLKLVCNVCLCMTVSMSSHPHIVGVWCSSHSRSYDDLEKMDRSSDLSVFSTGLLLFCRYHQAHGEQLGLTLSYYSFHPEMQDGLHGKEAGRTVGYPNLEPVIIDTFKTSLRHPAVSLLSVRWPLPFIIFCLNEQYSLQSIPVLTTL